MMEIDKTRCIAAYNKFAKMVEEARVAALPYMPYLANLSTDDLFSIDKIRLAELEYNKLKL